MRGKVRWFHAEKKHGFIVPDDGSADVFFTHAALADGAETRLTVGLAVDFELDVSGALRKASGVKPA